MSEESLKEKIATNIKMVRISQDWSAEEFAKQCGLDYKTYLAYEKGRPIPIANLITICKNLETSIDLITTKRPKLK